MLENDLIDTCCIFKFVYNVFTADFHNEVVCKYFQFYENLHIFLEN